MANLLKTYQLIADILSFKTDDSELENQLKKNRPNWEEFVKVASNHLVLPAIYCRLRNRDLIHLLPSDLVDYLEQITEINRNRNVSILKQANTIAQLLNEHKINYAFLKGTALLLGGFYNDYGERMIGDIDILIAEEDLERSFNLLQKNSYHAMKSSLGSIFFGHIHLPRLVSDKHIAAIELHNTLIKSHQVFGFSNKIILNCKTDMNGSYIPCISHLELHNILNYQINDKGNFYKEINFKTHYDSCLLIFKNSIDSSNKSFNDKRIKSYYSRAKTLFEDFNNLTKEKSSSFLVFRLRNSWFRMIWKRVLSIFSYLNELLIRLKLFVCNNQYRKAIWNDKSRILNHLKTKLFSYGK